MENKIIKHHFECESGITIDMLIRVEKLGITEILKRTFKLVGYAPRYEYYSGSYFLDSFDGSDNRDYSLDELIKTIDDRGYHDYKKCFWNHP